MIIQERQLRPPTAKELEARRIELERLTLNWEIDWDKQCITPDKTEGPCDCPKTEGRVHSYGVFDLSVLELIEFCKDYQIPYEAVLMGEGFDGELVLNWTHLVLCEGCGRWYASGEEHDTAPNSLHDYIVRARQASIERTMERDKGRLK